MSKEVLQYPYPLDLRWRYIDWFPLYQRRFRYSRFGLLADMDVRGAAFLLMAISMEQEPPATLSPDPVWLACQLHISVPEWELLMQRDINPLYGWVEVQCGKELRLTHPVMLEGLEVAVKANKLRQRGTKHRKPGTPPDAGRAPK